ncbi:MAG: plasmid recombination protein [Oscillospiraceae bacterium]|nr:plasmid recombination protein [Oscillospiraceae bacterium]
MSNSKNVSLSFRIDDGVVEHNNRDFIAKNVNCDRISLNIAYKKENLADKYHELFDKAVEGYNAKQKRADRKKSDYLHEIMKSKKEKLFREIIVQIGDKDNRGIGTINEEAAKEMLDEYMLEFEKRNPNLKVFNAVMHLDEATPHLHIDFIPICHSHKQGLSTAVSLKGALLEQGFYSVNRSANEQTIWAEKEKDHLEAILKKHGFSRDNKNIHRDYMKVDEYKEYAQKTCAAVAAKFIPQKNIGIRAEIALDIDRLIYSSENLADLLQKLKTKLGYEIKSDAKYIAVKSPKAQRFVRLKSLGEEYSPKNLEKRITEKEKFPKAVAAKSKTSTEIEQPFYATITHTIIEIRTLRYSPRKTNPKKIYTFDNDRDINFLSEQLLTMHDLNLDSRDKIYAAAEDFTKNISEKNAEINRLNTEIPTLKSDIAQIKLLFSDLKNSKDTMAQMKISTAREKAGKYGIKSEEDIENLERRLKLIPMYVQNLKSELIEEQLKLARVKTLISAYEEIVEGNYIDNLLKAQNEQENKSKQEPEQQKQAPDKII